MALAIAATAAKLWTRDGGLRGQPTTSKENGLSVILSFREKELAPQSIA
jgi:hypothetical protein